VQKYKAKHNAHGGQQIQGVSYWDTFFSHSDVDDNKVGTDIDSDTSMDVQTVGFCPSIPTSRC